MQTKHVFGSMLVTLPIFLLGACDAVEVPGTSFEFGGVPGAKTICTAEEPLTQWVVGPDPIWGIADSVGGIYLQQLTDVYRATTGWTYVLSGNTAQVLLIDRSGAFSQAVGRDGDGPGEFRWPTQIRSVGRDSLVVLDNVLMRLTYFDGSGGILGTNRLSPPMTPLSTTLTGVGPDGFLVFQAPEIHSEDRQGLGIYRYSVDGSLHDTLTILPHLQQVVIESDGRRRPTMLPFSGAAAVAVSARMIVAGSSDDPFLRVWHRDSRTTDSIPIPCRVSAASSTAREGLITLEGERFTDPAAFRERREFLEQVPFADSVPRFSRLLIDDAGNIWLGKWQGSNRYPTEWLVLDSSGAAVAMTEIPVGVWPTQVTIDRLLGIRRDSLGLYHAEQFPLLRQDSPVR